MNNISWRQMLKFILLVIAFDILYSFLAGFAAGLVSSLLKDFGINELTYLNFSVTIIAGTLTVWPAIYSAAKMTFKKDPIPQESIEKTSVILCLFLILYTAISVIALEGFSNAFSFLLIPVFILVAYSSARIYLKKFSN